jgi:DNA gyrase subunit A
MERPDLSQTTPDIRAYITHLETELARLSEGKRRSSTPAEPSEPETTLNVITISQRGMAKRTPRHLYSRQRRSGMGVFDLETAESDHPAHLAVADESSNLLLVTSLGRVFRLEVAKISVGDVRDNGESLAEHIRFHPNEQLVAALPEDGGEFMIMVSERGWVQRIRKSFLGKNLFPGMSFHDVKHGGNITSACWTRGSDELFIGTKLGKGIRFRETQVPERGGCLGVRVDQGDVTVAVTAVIESSRVFLISHDGKGTIRKMSGFRMNKAPGAGAKVALKTDNMIGAVTVKEGDELFIISNAGKIIRFKADEVPPKEGVVQGVNCMAVRNDVVTAVTATR